MLKRVGKMQIAQFCTYSKMSISSVILLQTTTYLSELHKRSYKHDNVKRIIPLVFIYKPKMDEI